MERVDHKTFIDEQNALAHLDSLRREIAEVSKSLSSMREEHDFLIKENVRIRDESVLILTQTREESEKLKYSIEVGHRKARDINEFLGKYSNSTLDISAMEQEAQIKLHEQNRLIGENATHIDRQTVLIEELKRHYDDKVKELTDISSHLEIIKTELAFHSNKVSSVRLDTESEINKIRESMVVAQKELDEINHKIEEGRSAVSVPLEILRSEEEKLNVLRNDLVIYEQRIRAQHEKVFPNRTMPM